MLERLYTSSVEVQADDEAVSLRNVLNSGCFSLFVLVLFGSRHFTKVSCEECEILCLPSRHPDIGQALAVSPGSHPCRWQKVPLQIGVETQVSLSYWVV